MAPDYAMSGVVHQPRELKAFAPALVLLAILAVINFVDRSNLSIAEPLLKDELRSSASGPSAIERRRKGPDSPWFQS